jgi:hypothetical protein
MAVLCVAVAVVCMAWQVPEAAIGAYLIFFVSKDDAGSSAILGLALIIVVVLAVTLAFLVTGATAGDPLLRVLTMAAPPCSRPCARATVPPRPSARWRGCCMSCRGPAWPGSRHWSASPCSC